MKYPEQALQVATITHLRQRLPKPWLVWANMNGGDSPSKRSHGIRVAMGLLKGLPDVMLCGPERRLIAIEFKAPPKALKSGGVSKAKAVFQPEQLAVINALGVLDVPTLVVRDLDQCLRDLAAMGVPLRGMAR
jgi:hypothetical protein